MSTEKGARKKVIPLKQDGFHFLTASQNPDDPFVYFGYGDALKSLGAVNLVTGEAFYDLLPDAQDCVISASGKVLYRNRSAALAGLESFVRTSSTSDERPSFTRLHHEPKIDERYVPDQLESFTAAGNNVYSRSLAKHEATLDFSPRCFLRKQPIVVGIVTDRPNNQPANEIPLVLRAASTNSFETFKTEIKIPDLTLDDVTAVDEFFEPNRTRFFADEEWNQIVIAMRNKIILVRMNEFLPPVEPILQATLEGSTRFVVGHEGVLKVKPFDPQAKITIVNMPSGMKGDAAALVWTPTDSQVGRARLEVQLESGKLERRIEFDLTALYPSIDLPFVAGGIAVSTDGKLATIVEGPPHSQPGEFQLAAIDLPSGKIRHIRKLPQPPQALTYVDGRIAIGNGRLGELMTASGLVTLDGLSFQSPVFNLLPYGKFLVAETQAGVEVFDPATGRRLKQVHDQSDNLFGNRYPAVTEHGLRMRQNFYDENLKPTLLLGSYVFPTLLGDNPISRFHLLKSLQPTPYPSLKDQKQAVDPVRITAANYTPGKQNVELELTRKKRRASDDESLTRESLELAVVTLGPGSQRHVLVEEDVPEFDVVSLSKNRPKLWLTPADAWILCGQRLLRWPLPAKQSEDSLFAAPTPPRFVPRQSDVEVKGREKLVLHHQVVGLNPAKHTFAIQNTHPGITIDPSTGDVTVDGNKLMVDCQLAAEFFFKRTSNGQPYPDAFRLAARDLQTRLAEVLSRTSEETPVAIPIYVELRDERNVVDRLSYFVLTLLQAKTVLGRLENFEAERTGQPLPNPSTPAAADPNTPSVDPVDALKQRVEQLEKELRRVKYALNQLQAERNQPSDTKP